MFKLTTKDKVRASLKESMPTSPLTALYESVPVSSTTNNPAIITIHTHKIIVAREGKFYRFLSVLESITLVAASLSLISLSGASIVFALSMMS